MHSIQLTRDENDGYKASAVYAHWQKDFWYWLSFVWNIWNLAFCRSMWLHPNAFTLSILSTPKIHSFPYHWIENLVLLSVRVLHEPLTNLQVLAQYLTSVVPKQNSNFRYFQLTISECFLVTVTTTWWLVERMPKRWLSLWVRFCFPRRAPHEKSTNLCLSDHQFVCSATRPLEACESLDSKQSWCDNCLGLGMKLPN